MNEGPHWLKPVATAVALLIAAVLLAGIVASPVRYARSPEGYNQEREHWNTKNTTRFIGNTLEEVAAQVSRAVYPSTLPENTPSVVLLYEPADWQGGLQAASLLRLLNGVLLPASGQMLDEIEQLHPSGADILDGAQVLLVNAAADPGTGLRTQTLDTREMSGVRAQLSEQPRHALLLDGKDPQTALLAAPWLAYSGDMAVFDPSDAPEGLPLYVLGNAEAPEGTKRIGGADPARTAVAFAMYEDPENPLFGWGMNAGTTTGYRAYTLARPDDPGMALLSANLARRGKTGPLMWSGERTIPASINDYFWSQRAAFWITPSEGPFHHFYVLGGLNRISFPAQSQADYAVEIGPYKGKGDGMSGIDMLAAAWIFLGAASGIWILFHESKFLTYQNWIMRLAWPLAAFLMGPFSLPVYILSYQRPLIRMKNRVMWDRPLWLQGLVATISAVSFGATIMIVTGFMISLFGIPLFPSQGPLFFLGAPMILIMIFNYVVAVIVSWLLFQTPMLAMFYGLPYRQTLFKALPMVLISMTAAAAAMNPGMWWLMMWNLPMMPSEESILWFGVMLFTGFLALLLAWPFNTLLVVKQRKSGLM